TEAQRFPDPAPCTQQYSEQRPPVAVHRMVGDMLHKGPLLSHRQSVAYSAMLVRIFLYLCQYPICGVIPDDAITNRQLKRRTQKRMDAFQRIDLHLLLLQQAVIKLKHIRESYIRDLLVAEGVSDKAVIHIQIVASGCLPEIGFQL